MAQGFTRLITAVVGMLAATCTAQVAPNTVEARLSALEAKTQLVEGQLGKLDQILENLKQIRTEDLAKIRRDLSGAAASAASNAAAAAEKTPMHLPAPTASQPELPGEEPQEITAKKEPSGALPDDVTTLFDDQKATTKDAAADAAAKLFDDSESSAKKTDDPPALFDDPATPAPSKKTDDPPALFDDPATPAPSKNDEPAPAGAAAKDPSSLFDDPAVRAAVANKPDTGERKTIQETAEAIEKRLSVLDEIVKEIEALRNEDLVKLQRDIRQMQPTAGHAPRAMEPAGIAAGKAGTPARVIIQNYTGTSHLVSINGVNYRVEPGESEVETTYGRVTTQLNGLAERQWELRHWRKVGDQYQMLLELRQ